MDFQEKLLIVLYAAIAVFVAVQFYDLWNLAIVLFGILVISLVQKISIEKRVKSVESGRERVIDVITQRIDSFSGNIASLKSDFSKNIEFLDNKINVVNSIYEGEMKKGYADISSRISSFEERIERIRGALDEIYNSMDSRLSSLENRGNESA